MKTLYVRVVHAVRAVLAATGLLGLLDRWARRSRTGLWVRSWFAIHDVEDLIGLDVPWWTFESVDAVEAHLRARPAARVFEWGSGASTRWLGRRAAEVHTVEHHEAWARTMAPLLPPNAVARVVPAVPSSTPAVPSAKPGHAGLDFTSYVDAIDDVPGEFDLVVVDGRAREACLPKGLARLAPGGLLVFDNVDRERYRQALGAAGDRIEVRWTRGRTPCLPYPTRTALVRVRP